MTPLRTVLAFSLSSIAAAQWLDDKPLGSCADVKCPPASNGTVASSCQIANQTYGGVGVDKFPSSITANASWQNLTWTVAFHDYTNYDPEEKLERTIEKAFFLGTPEDFNLNEVRGYHGCAVILEAYDNVWDEDERFSCDNAIGSECHAELLHQTLSFARNQAGKTNNTGTNSMGDVCEELEDYLTSVNDDDSDESACDSIWTQVRIVALTGPSAPQPPSEHQNSTTNCHPTEPKSNDLTLVMNWNNTGTMYVNDTIRMLRSVNVALTVFWGDEGTNVMEPESHMSCLIPVDETTQSRETTKPNEAMRTKGATLAMLGAAMMMTWELL